MMVTVLTSIMLLVIQRLITHSYPVQAKKRQEIEKVRTATVVLDEICQQIHFARQVQLESTGTTSTTPVSLATDKLAIRWNLDHNRVVDRYSVNNVTHVLLRERLNDSYVWDQPATWVALAGYTAPGREILREVESCETVQRTRSGINLLEVRVKLLNRPSWVSRMVGLP